MHELLQLRSSASTSMEVYPGCGHVPMDDSRERFEADVTGFVEGVFATSPAAVSASQPGDGVAPAGLQDTSARVDAMQTDPDAQLQVVGSE